MRWRFATLLAPAIVLVPALSQLAAAQVKVDATISPSGPVVSLGIPQRNSIALLPKCVGSMGAVASASIIVGQEKAA